MRSRPLIPGGRSGLLILAIAAVPLVLSKCKPLAKRLAEKMDKWSEKLKEDAARPEPTAAQTAEAPEAKPEAAKVKETKPDAKAAAPKSDAKPKAAPKKTASKPKSSAKPTVTQAPKPKKPKAGS